MNDRLTMGVGRFSVAGHLAHGDYFGLRHADPRSRFQFSAAEPISTDTSLPTRSVERTQPKAKQAPSPLHLNVVVHQQKTTIDKPKPPPYTVRNHFYE